MIRPGTILAAAVAVAALAGPAGAGEAQDRLFEVGLLDGIATGDRLVYRHQRSGSFDAGRVPAIDGEEIGIALVSGAEGRREAHVTLTGSRGRPTRARLPAGGGHPLLLVFLETTVDNMAAMTGGSPHYIRNRMREALGQQDVTEPVEVTAGGAEVAGTRLTFTPFTGDPNRGEMGAFAELELRVVLSDAVPGEIASLSAVTGPGADGTPVLRERMVFERIEEEE